MFFFLFSLILFTDTVFLFIHTTYPTGPTLATNVSRWGNLSHLRHITHPTCSIPHPRYKRKPVGQDTTHNTSHRPHPRYKRKSVGPTHPTHDTSHQPHPRYNCES